MIFKKVKVFREKMMFLCFLIIKQTPTKKQAICLSQRVAIKNWLSNFIAITIWFSQVQKVELSAMKQNYWDKPQNVWTTFVQILPDLISVTTILRTFADKHRKIKNLIMPKLKGLKSKKQENLALVLQTNKLSFECVPELNTFWKVQKINLEQ